MLFYFSNKCSLCENKTYFQKQTNKQKSYYFKLCMYIYIIYSKRLVLCRHMQPIIIIPYIPYIAYKVPSYNISNILWFSTHSGKYQTTEVKWVANAFYALCNTFYSHIRECFHAVTNMLTYMANCLWVHLLPSMAVSSSRAGSGSGALVFTLLLSLSLSLSLSFSLSLSRLWCALSSCRLCCLFFWASNAFSLRACLWPL